jgi:hypothetical protein
MPETLGLPLQAAALAALVALPLAVFGPPPGDLPAHLYRTFLVEEGVLLWDGHWYGGHYPLFSYSLLYYFPAGLVGNELFAVAAVIAAAGLFAAVAEREWGAAARWPALAFAVFAAGPLFTGTYPYAAGLAAALAGLLAFQAGRPWLGLAAATLTVGFSPLAFLFLGLALAAAVLAARRLSRRIAAFAGIFVLIGLVPVAAARLFPHDATYPFFRLIELLILIVLAGLGGWLARRDPRGNSLALFLVLWAIASVLAFLVPSPVGENITRLRGIVFPLVLLAAALARFRPVGIAALAVAGAFAYNIVPWVAVIPHRTDGRPAQESFWRPAMVFLAANHAPGFRVEVVPTGDHWEAYWLPKEGFPLTRGWYRQLDHAQNRLFYEEPLQPAEYRAWLRRMGVRYVLLPDTQLGRMGEEREAELLRSGRSGLVRTAAPGAVTIYELPGATPILPGGVLTRYDHDRIEGQVPGPGTYPLSVRWTPYLRVESGTVRLERVGDDGTRLIARAGGRFVLEVGLR